MPKVKIYTTATCVYCKAEKAFLSDKQVAFEEVHVDQDAAAAEEMIQATGQMGVPVTVIENGSDKQTIIGFDRPRLEQALGL